jgi:hypothetical protein
MTTAGMGNVPVSILEDLVSTVVSLLSVIVPIMVACLVVPLIGWLVWLVLRRNSRYSNT